MKAVWLLLLASLAEAQPTTDCDRGGPLTARGIGRLEIGMRVDSFARACRLVASTLVDGSTLHTVRVGSDTVRAFENDGRIAWIEVDSPRLRTRDSLGVGSTPAAILYLPDVVGIQGATQGTNTFALAPKSGPHCGLVFWLDPRTSEMLNATRGDRLRMLGMRGGGTVIQVDIQGECRK